MTMLWGVRHANTKDKDKYKDKYTWAKYNSDECRTLLCEVREHCMKGDVMRMRLPMGNVEGRLTTVLMKTKSEKGGGRTPQKMRNHLSLSKS